MQLGLHVFVRLRILVSPYYNTQNIQQSASGSTFILFMSSKSNSLTDYLWSFDVTKEFRSLELVLIASIWAITWPSIGTLSPKVSRLLPSASVLVEIMVTMVTNPLATLKVLSVRDKQCLKKTENKHQCWLLTYP